MAERNGLAPAPKNGRPVKVTSKGGIDHARVVESVEHSRKTLEHFRSARRDRIALYAGGDYSEETGPVPRPLNLIRQYVDVFGRNLVSKAPRVMLRTFSRKQKPAVRAMQDWVNRHIERTDLVSVLQRAVIDALFQVGVVKVALATPADAALSGYGLEPGDPYACSVSLNDLVYDVFAQTTKSLQYVGHWVRVPIDAVRDSKVYGPGRRELEPTEKREYGADGDEVASTLSGWASHGTKTEAFEMVDLLELYFPRQKKWCTYGGDGHGTPRLYKGGPLREADWVGPHCGPFHWLGFGCVPDCVMPAGTVANLTDIDVAANDVFRKLWRQAQRAKTVDVVEAGNAEDAKTLREASDGSIVGIRNLAGVAKVTTGGPMPELVAFLQVLRELFNFMGGNVATVGGLATQADTASQEKMLNANAGAGVTDMQGDVVRFTASVMDAYGWFYWENPFKVMKTEYHRKGMERPLPRSLYPAGARDGRGRRRALRREQPYEELDKRLDPYSIAYSTPGQRAARVRSFFMQIVAPVMPLLPQMGAQFDLEKFVKLLGDYEDEPDYADMLSLAEPLRPDQSGGGDAAGASGPAQTVRRYERSDTGGGGGPSGAEMMMQAAQARGGQNGQQQGGGVQTFGG